MSPRWSLNLNPNYEIDLANGGTIALGANYAYRSKQYHTEFNDERLAQKAYSMVDANIMYRAPGNALSVNLWVKNLTDELVYAGSFSVSTSRAIGGTLMPPRTYGVTVGYNF
jgi:iron complex outermembrane recepter protein